MVMIKNLLPQNYGCDKEILNLKGGYICYASANIKALETLGYAEHICNYVVILDSWFYGKVHAHLTDLIRVNCVIGQLTLLVRYDFIFLDFSLLRALHKF